MTGLKRLLIALLVVDLVANIAVAVIGMRLKRERVNVGDELSDAFDFSTIFEGLEFASRAPALRDGAWLTYCGGGVLDLSAAQLDPAGATLRLRAAFGGGEVRVPANCRVVLQTRGLAGGVGNAAADMPDAPDVRTLTVDAACLFGGFGIVRAAAD